MSKYSLYFPVWEYFQISFTLAQMDIFQPCKGVFFGDIFAFSQVGSGEGMLFGFEKRALPGTPRSLRYAMSARSRMSLSLFSQPRQGSVMDLP